MRHVFGRDLTGFLVPPELIETFAQGWARSRGVAPPARDGQALRIEVGLPAETRRYLFPRPPAGIADLARTITAPLVLIKAPYDAADVAALLPPGWQAERTGTMMTLDRLPDAAPALPPGITLISDRQGDIRFVRLIDQDGAEAGHGRVTIVDGWAIHDRIGVADAHRRRGLGRAIMLWLGAVARGDGAQHGLLTATAAGRALYETLGWSARTPWTTAQIRQPDQTSGPGPLKA